jgi:hypothetical protein
MILPMTFAELDISPRGRGRAAKPLLLEAARDLEPADLALLASERGVKPPQIKVIRERHHALARCLAAGMKPAEASVITGYDPSRISILKADPTFAALIEDYKSMNDGVTADFVQRTQTLSLTVVNRLQEAVEDEENLLSPGTLLEIAKFAADRTGNAPVMKNLNVNVNAELGSKLNAARRRLAEAESAGTGAGAGTRPSLVLPPSTSETSHSVIDAVFVEASGDVSDGD